MTLKVIRQLRDLSNAIRRTFVPNANYVSIFYRFRDIAGYLSKVADFDHPTSIRRPRRG